MRRLRIGIDGRMAGPVMTGLGRYARALAANLPPLDPRNEYVIIRRGHAPMPLAAGDNVEDAVVEGDLDQPGNLLSAGALNRLGLDLYHSLSHFVPPGLRVPRIVITLHDVIWLEQADLCFDERFSWLKARVTNFYARAAMRHAARRAVRVISVSAHSRERGISVLGLDPARVHVVHHGVDRAEFPPFDGQHDQDALSREDPYFLCLGNTKPYKNVRASMEAFASLVREGRTCRLVVTGRSDSRRNLEEFAARLGVAERVAFTGPVTHARLLQLFHGAVGLVFASLVEGFGLPLLEAMSTGCPVVASTAPAVAEICGDAALLPDPRSPERIADAMRRLLDDRDARLELRERGFRQAARFDWRTCAEGTLAVYRAAVEEAT